jgi:hypothetical protein
MNRFDRFIRTLLGFIAGILIGNVFWILQSAAYWGGGGNILGCLILPAIAVGIWWIAMEVEGE